MEAELQAMVVHLGVGLIFHVFHKYEEAVSNLFHSHQLAVSLGDNFRQDVAEQCLLDALDELIKQKKPGSLIPHFIKFSKSPSDHAWCALFVGSSRHQILDDNHTIRWLQNTLRFLENLPDDPCNLQLKFRASKRLGEIEKNWSARTKHFKTQKEAAEGLQNLDYVVDVVSRHARACLENDEFEEATRVSQELQEIAEQSGDPLHQAFSDVLSGEIAYRLGQLKKCIKYNNRVVMGMIRTKMHLWSECFSLCATSQAGPVSAEKTFSRINLSTDCILKAWFRLAEAHSKQLEFDHALRALEGYSEFCSTLSPGHRSRNMIDLHYLECFCMVYGTLAAGSYDFATVNPSSMPSDWTERLESAIAEALQLSHESFPRTYATALHSAVKLATHFRSGFYLENSDLEILDSFNAEAERLTRLHDPKWLPAALYERSLLLFRMQSERREEMIEKLEECCLLLSEAFCKFGPKTSLSRDRILFTDTWKHSFRMLQAAFARAEEPTFGLVWAERERARDLLRSLKLSQTAKSIMANLELLRFDFSYEEAMEEIDYIAQSAGEDTVFLVYTSLAHDWGVCGFLLHSSRKSCSFVRGRVGEPVNSETIRSLWYNHHNMTLLHYWYDLLLSPFDEVLEKIKPRKLVIVPGEASISLQLISLYVNPFGHKLQQLSALPFTALHKGFGEPFLIQKYAISCSPSLRMYMHCKIRGEKLMKCSTRNSALVVGDPSSSLHYAEEEARFVKDSLQKAGFDHVKLLEKEGAVKPAVMSALPTSDWVHFACHGFTSHEFPHGALLLANEENDESSPWHALTGDDLETYGVKMRALVTVLSACETGLGEERSEGVLGLSRSFHVAGAPSVVCSLVRVDDEETKMLMQKLYEKLVNGVELVFALQEAMVEMIEDNHIFLHVRNWAAFIVSGYPQTKLVF